MNALGQLQQLLMSIHGVDAEPVADYLVGAKTREALAPATSDEEALLVSEEGEELRIGLFLADGVLREIERGAHEPWTHPRLRAFTTAAEGVSHFLYLQHRARSRRQVSQLELEAQGELDKYLAVLLQLWAVGRRAASAELRHRLFERVSLRPGLSDAERDRYVLATALAAACAKALELRFVREGKLDGLLRESRRLYRLSGGEKFSALAHGAVAWAA